MEKIIKNCRGVKKCNDDINRMKKEEPRENFRVALVFKEHDIMLARRILNKVKNKENVSRRNNRRARQSLRIFH